MVLSLVDYLIFVIYFGFVIGIGWLLYKKVSASSDFLTCSHSAPLWITSLAFVATNLGAISLLFGGILLWMAHRAS